MSFPKITSALSDDKIVITDESSYGDTNPLRTDVTDAKITCWYNNKRIHTYDVTSGVVAGTTEFNFDPDDIKDFDKIYDGVYKFFLILTTSAQTLRSMPDLEFVYEDVKRDASKMWAKLATMYDRYKYGQFLKEVSFIELHISGMDAFKERGMEKNFLSILKITQDRIIINI